MAMENLDGGMPSLEDVMKGGMDSMPDNGKGKADDDLGFDLDDKPFDPFAKEEGDGDRLENDPDRKEARKDEVVFEVADDEDLDADNDDDFKDNRKKTDAKKNSRLQREMRLKAEAREQLTALGKQVDRLAAEATDLARNEMRARRGIAEMARSTAINDIRRFEEDIKRAQESGETAEIGRISKAQAEAEAIILKADALIERYREEVVSKYIYDPKIPDALRDPNNGGTSKGKDWVDANAAWFNNPDKYGAEIAFAKATDTQMIKEKKFEPNTDEYFNELTRRVALNMRHIEVHTADGRIARIGERQRGGSKVADTTGSGARQGANQTRRPDNGGKDRETISGEEQRMLRAMGLDTSNPEHLKELKANRIR